MPKYTFKCPKCNLEEQNYVPLSVTEVLCERCSPEKVLMQRQLPRSTGATDVNEVIDKHTGITWKKDQKELIKERHDDYYWSIEVPRLVQSGTYSVETMLENGWIYLDDDNKVQINTKSPNKR